MTLISNILIGQKCGGLSWCLIQTDPIGDELSAQLPWEEEFTSELNVMQSLPVRLDFFFVFLYLGVILPFEHFPTSVELGLFSEQSKQPGPQSPLIFLTTCSCLSDRPGLLIYYEEFTCLN